MLTLKINDVKKLILLLLLLPACLLAQKKIIDHNAYYEWNKIEKQQISNDGLWIAYETTPLIGDGFVCYYNLNTQQSDTVFRGKDPKFNADSKLLLIKITPGYDTLRNCELNKIDKKKWPKDSLLIIDLSTLEQVAVPKIKQFKIAENGGRIAFSQEEVSESSTAKKCKLLFWKKPKTPVKTDGFDLKVMNNSIQIEFTAEQATNFNFSDDGEELTWISHQKVKKDSFELHVYNFSSKTKIDFPARTMYQLPVWNFDKSHIAFLNSMDTAKTKQFNLSLFENSTKRTQIIELGDTTSKKLPFEKGISEFRNLQFSSDGSHLFFGVADRVKAEIKDTLLASEKVNLDIWHYRDEHLQSQQLVELKETLKKNDLYSLDILSAEVHQINNDTLSLILPNKNWNINFVLGEVQKPYSIEAQWKMPTLTDYYSVNLLTGKSTLLQKAALFQGDLSPSGRYFGFYNPKDQQFYLWDSTFNTSKCITCQAKDVLWQEDVNGQAQCPGPISSIEFMKGEDAVVLTSEYDIWEYIISSNTLTCLTDFEGKKNQIEFRIKKWSADSMYLDWENSYIQGFDLKTKTSSVHQLFSHDGHRDFKLVYQGPFIVNYCTRSKNTDRVVLKKMTLLDYPELVVLDSSFNKEQTITRTNPQQKDYNWATVSLLKWQSYDGTPLEGLLYKPEDYSPDKKYPLLIYYYELNSATLHNHITPKPSASTINITEYASAGYLVFVPDIRYKLGHPAKSAYNSIMSGTDYLLKNFSIDSTKMGLQGQSWGGYQTAQVITMTNRYAAAMAGAPVGNMFSAYGGIRWGTGINRQFQYESTQSRIGKTIWEAPELYFENSPLFHLPKVKTPLLIMANDSDGSVPWYQGLELYNGMRRLEKPCWMFNYNADDHNLTRLPNKIDLSIRMRQFFDHYLMNQPAPIWMIEGIPAVSKGKVSGY